VRTADRGVDGHGMFLFFIGLVTGPERAALHKYAHGAFPRIWRGVMNGMFLTVLGCDLGSN